MQLVKEFSDRWWIIALRGLVALILGLVLITYPGKSLVVVTWIVGLWALIEGLILMISSLFKHKEIEGWGMVFLQGLLGVALGLALMAIPQISLGILFFLVGLWFVLVGIVLIVQAIEIRKEIMGGEWIMIATAILSIIFGMLMMGNLQVSVAVAGFLIGVMMLIMGIMTIAFGFQLKREGKKIEKALKV
jgi:uncharacterized membrane protein HdeD (DUF308 family)